jgi:hypothetical protein
MDIDGSLDLDGSLDIGGLFGFGWFSWMLVLSKIFVGSSGSGWFFRTGLVFFGLGWFFQGIWMFFRRTIIQPLHILVRAEGAYVTGKRNYFYLVSLYWANLRSKKDILATLS